MKKVKYNGPMPYVKVWSIGHFDCGVPVEVTDEQAVMLLREPGFSEVREKPVKKSYVPDENEIKEGDK